MNLSNRKRLLSIGVISIICVVFLGFGSCKPAAIPAAVAKVINGCGVAIDIFLNGEYKFFLENDQSQSLEDLSNGDHVLEVQQVSISSITMEKPLIFMETMFIRDLLRIKRMRFWSMFRMEITNWKPK